MKRAILLALLCLLIGLGTAWASPGEDFALGTVYLSTISPGVYTDPIDWCVQFGCLNDYTVYSTPQPFASAGGVTGLVGLVSTMQGFYNLQQGPTWFGNFPAGMGLVYNGAAFGNTPTSIAMTFDSAIYGLGAYVQYNYLLEPYTATLTLFDQNYLPISSISLTDTVPFTTLWISLSDGSQDVWAAQFDVNSAVPEPSSLLLLGTSALGLAGYLRRRLY